MFDSNAGDGGGQRLWNKFLSIFNKGKDEVVRSSKVSKTRLDLSSLKKERERVFERLGEEIYKRHMEKKFSLPGLDPFFTEIDIITLKLSSKERELKGLKGEEVQDIQSAPPDRTEHRGRHYRRRRKGPHPAKEAAGQKSPSPAGESVKAEVAEPGGRPRRKYHRPRRKPSDIKQEVESE